MIYLIGVRHDIQFDPAPHVARIVRDKRAAFKVHVLEVIEKFRITVLAEEFNDEAKKMWRVNETTLERIAKDKGIEHRFSDPTAVERNENEIEKSDSDKREQFWLSCIQDCKDKNVLFVCGDDHFDSFGKKLSAAGFDMKRGLRLDISDADVWATYGL
jgi:hypothetical protein